MVSNFMYWSIIGVSSSATYVPRNFLISFSKSIVALPSKLMYTNIINKLLEHKRYISAIYVTYITNTWILLPWVLKKAIVRKYYSKVNSFKSKCFIFVQKANSLFVFWFIKIILLFWSNLPFQTAKIIKEWWNSSKDSTFQDQNKMALLYLVILADRVVCIVHEYIIL